MCIRDSSQSGDVTTVVIVLALVGLSGLVSFVQGERSGKAAAALQSMISNQVDVVREGETRSIPIDQVVPGDVVRLSAGDIIPGDVRFLAAKDAFLSQAALTGESAPVEKFAQLPGGEEGALTDLGDLGFMLSLIHIFARVPAHTHTLQEWNDAAAYLLGEDVEPFDDPEQAKAFLQQHPAPPPKAQR